MLKKADGAAVAPKDGFPTVKLAANGEPTITIPKADPPTALSIEVLKKGTGKVVKDGATVTVHYIGALWKDGKVFDSSWNRGAPATFPTAGSWPASARRWSGRPSAHRSIAVIPPAEGYGPDGNQTDPNTPDQITGTDTMVFVIDILAVS